MWGNDSGASQNHWPMESQQRPKNLTPSLLWGDLAARATSGEAHMMDSDVTFKNYFVSEKSFSLIFCIKALPACQQPRCCGHATYSGVNIGKYREVLRPQAHEQKAGDCLRTFGESP